MTRLSTVWQVELLAVMLELYVGGVAVVDDSEEIFIINGIVVDDDGDNVVVGKETYLNAIVTISFVDNGDVYVFVEDDVKGNARFNGVELLVTPVNGGEVIISVVDYEVAIGCGVLLDGL
ncbi:hypothetical protein NDU88_000391 [Pleurodeles waltl]|uniref:Uncharacterized protein n=1 Tax=Pleurodeles waltl TaxID=8319 RepID=A0AAV7S6P7_PLEWA|nr:hypothetical protein NDU88_000391 [Pleurodeles waltl]